MGNVPKLRFPEFSGEWEKKKLELILKIKHGKDQKTIEHKNGVYPILATSGIIGYTNTAICMNESVLIGRKGTINKPQYMKTPFWTIDTLFYSEVYPGNFVKFVYYLFQTINWLEYNEASGVPSLSAATIERIKVTIPNLPEQTKIATFLTLFDIKIEKQAEKVAALEEYKKGLMQKIFSREIRFKDNDGKDYQEWSNKLFGDIFSFHPTYSYSRAMLNMDTGSIKYIHYGDIHTKYPITLDIQNNQIPYLNNTTPSKAISSSSFCKEGDLVIADASEDYDAIGKATVLKNIGNDKIISGLHTILARDEQDHIAHSFRGYLFASEGVKKQIRFSAVGAKVLGISKTNLAKIRINLPCFDEQTKIATFLTLFDRKIEKEKEKLDALREQKKGLLQQMFV